jgi:hypothetical protein
VASLQGDREGHAVLGYVTAEGRLRWVDPLADRGVSEDEERPASLGGMSAAWAVVIGPDQTVAEPGDWAAESTGAVPPLVDMPRRRDVGRMGQEEEQRAYMLYLPGKSRLPENTVLLRSPDGLVTIASDNGRIWLGRNSVPYESAEAMTAAGAAPADTGSERHPGLLQISVPETITEPWSVLEGEQGHAPDPERVAGRVREVRRHLARVPPTHAFPATGVKLTGLFPDYEVLDPLARDVLVARLAGVFEGAPLLVHLSVGTAVGGGALAVLADLAASIDSRLHKARAVDAALRFGWQVASLYLRDTADLEVPESDMPVLALDWNLTAITEVMALVFVQLDAILRYEAHRNGIIKTRMAVVPRQSLHELRSALGADLRGFFNHRAGDIEELFRAAYVDLDPDYARTYNATRSLPAQADIDLLEVGRDGDVSVRQLLNEILRPRADGPRVDPAEDFGIGLADTGGLDRSRGNVPGLPEWLLVLELRMFSRAKYDLFERPGTFATIDAEMADQNIARLTEVARNGDACAGLAGRLDTRPEGQEVLYWLRTALALPAEDQRIGAVMYLIDSVRSYLLRYPQDTAALQRALQPAADHFRVLGFSQLV